MKLDTSGSEAEKDWCEKKLSEKVFLLQFKTEFSSYLGEAEITQTDEACFWIILRNIYELGTTTLHNIVCLLSLFVRSIGWRNSVYFVYSCR